MVSLTLVQLMATLFSLQTLHLVALQELHKHLPVNLRPLRSYLLSPTQQVVTPQQVLLCLQLVAQANLVLAHLLLVVQLVVLSVQFKQVHARIPTMATKLYQQTVVFLKQLPGAHMESAKHHVPPTHSAQVILLRCAQLVTIQKLDGIFA